MATERKMEVCVECGRVFLPKTKRSKICESCKKYRYHNIRQKAQQKKKPALSIVLVSRIERIYNKVNGTFKHYGEIVNIIEGTPPDRCVCCGDVIPKGRMVCPNCEQKGSRWNDG